MRGQATSIQHPVRSNLHHQQPNVFRTKLPSTPGISFVSGRLGHQRDQKSKVRTFRTFIPNTWKPPDVSSLHNFCRTRATSIPKDKGANLLLLPRQEPIEWWS